MNRALFFSGAGTDQASRLRISLDDPPRTADVGAGDFTVEWWMKAAPGDNAEPTAGFRDLDQAEVADHDWIYGNVVIDRDIYGDNDPDWGISVHRNGAAAIIRFGTGGNYGENGNSEHTLQGHTDVFDGQWHHVAVVRDASTGIKRIYVDGVLDAESAAGVSTANVSYPDGRALSASCAGLPYGPLCVWEPFLVVGAEKHDIDPAVYPSFRGFLDEIRLWNTARSADEVASSKDTILADLPPALVGYWRLDDAPDAAFAADETADANAAEKRPPLDASDTEHAPLAGYDEATDTPTATEVPTSTTTDTPSPSATPSPGHTATPTRVLSRTPTGTATRRPTSTPTSTPTRVPTRPPSATRTATRTATRLPTLTPTSTRKPSATPSLTPTRPPTRTPTAAGITTRTPTSASAAATRTPTRAATSTSTSLPSRTPTPRPTSTATRVPTRTPTLLPTRTATRAPTGTPSAVLTRTPTTGPSRTPTRPPTFTPTRSPTRAPSNSPTPVLTRTPTTGPTRTPTRAPTSTATQTPTLRPTVPPTLTRTRTPTITQTPTRTLYVSPTRTFTSTPTPTATPTATCANGLRWDLSQPTVVSVQSGGNIWLTKTVPTDTGWGVFWVRQDPGATQFVHIFYAHVDFQGGVTVAPMRLVDTHLIPFRGKYFNVAWHDDHYGLIVADLSTLYYFDVTKDGVISNKHAVGPTLFVSDVYDEECDSDFDAYPGGFLGVIEGDCEGHSCSYAFRLDAHGVQNGLYNIVDFDFTHQFFPKAAYDGTGFAIISVKDIDVSLGGVGTKYMTATTGPGDPAKVIPNKPYLWDEWPDIAWNGGQFGAVWQEVPQTPPSGQPPVAWRIHFASFLRNATKSTLIKDQVLDSQPYKSNLRWTIQMHAVGGDWVAQHSRWQANGAPLAVFDLVDSQGQVHATKTPFTLTADALGSSVHWADGQAGRIGIAWGGNDAGSCSINFQVLEPPACQ